MAQTLVQTSSELTFTGTTSTVVLNGVTAGNALSHFGSQETDATAIATTTDDKGDTFTNVHTENGANGGTSVQVAKNAVGGNTTFTCGVAAGSKLQYYKVQEWSGSSTTTQPDGSDSQLQAGSTTHTESASGINPTTGCVVITASACASTPTSPTPGSGYTSVATSNSFGFWQYQIFSSAPTNEKGTWTSGNAPGQAGAMLAIKAGAAAAARQQTLTLLGCGV